QDSKYTIASSMEFFAGDNAGSGSYESDVRISTTAPNQTKRQERMRVTGEGNVGIGTLDPEYKLDVAGTINADEILMNGSAITSAVWKQAGDVVSYNTGNVGIGTESPDYLLDINSDISTGNRTLLNIENINQSTTSTAALEIKSGSSENYTVLRMHGDNYSYSWWGKHGQLKTVGDGLIIEATKADNSGGDIRFVNGSTGGSLNIKTVNMMITGAGNVGVGTDSPAAKLQIKSGDIYLEDISSGVIMKSPNGNCWRMTVDDSGAMVTTSVSCPQ
ncbi:MAG: hypothetical protein WBA74_00750, partial [Cyclobacteriaceae bacterium]